MVDDVLIGRALGEMGGDNVVQRNFAWTSEQHIDKDPDEHHGVAWLEIEQLVGQRLAGRHDEVLGKQHENQWEQNGQTRQEAEHDTHGTQEFDNDQNGHGNLGRQAQKTVKRGHYRIKVQHLADAQLQEHDAREQTQEKARQVAIGVTRAVEK